MGLLILAIPLSILGNFLNSVGYIIQKKGHIQVMEQSMSVEGEKPSYVKNKLWWIGFITYTIGSLMHGIALGQGPQSLLTPMESVTLIANTFLCPIFLNEKLKKRDIYAVIFIMIGCTLAVYFGPKADADYTSTELMEKYLGEIFVISSSIIICIVIIDFFVVKRVEAHCDRYNIVQDGTMRPYGAVFLVISYTTIAGVIGSYNVLFTKSVFEMLTSSVVDKGTELDSIWFYLILCAFILANLYSEIWKQRALGVFGALYVVPIYQVIVIVGGISIGALYFLEFSGLNTVDILLFIVGICFTLTGVYVLAATEGRKTHSLKNIVKYKIIPMIRTARVLGMTKDLTIEELTSLDMSLPLPDSIPFGEMRPKSTSVVIPETLATSQGAGPNEVEAHASVSGWGQLLFNYVKQTYIRRPFPFIKRIEIKSNVPDTDVEIVRVNPNVTINMVIPSMESKKDTILDIKHQDDVQHRRNSLHTFLPNVVMEDDEEFITASRNENSETYELKEEKKNDLVDVSPSSSTQTVNNNNNNNNNNEIPPLREFTSSTTNTSSPVNQTMKKSSSKSKFGSLMRTGLKSGALEAAVATLPPDKEEIKEERTTHVAEEEHKEPVAPFDESNDLDDALEMVDQGQDSGLVYQIPKK